MKVDVRPSFGLFVAVMVVLSCRAVGWPAGLWAGLLVAASVLLHEAAHAVAAFSLGVRTKCLGGSLKGGYIIREYATTRLGEAVITLAGPSFNLLLCLAFLLIPSKFSWWVALMNLVLCVTNLLPLGPTDGARLLRPRCTMLPAAPSAAAVAEHPAAQYPDAA
jgi:Zn-dependent protease